MSGDLVTRLQGGVPCIGLHDDNSTELFAIEAADETMHEAAARIKALQAALAQAEAERDGLHKALARVMAEIGLPHDAPAFDNQVHTVMLTMPSAAAMNAAIRQLKGQHHD
jgi:hypothetical protein